jgi:hypothetical protein
MIILDLDSSVSPTHGDQEGTAYNGHFGCTCYHRVQEALSFEVIFGQTSEVAGLFDAGIAAPAHVADVRVAELPAPQAGDRLVVDAVTYTIRQAHQDAERLVWRLDLDPI